MERTLKILGLVLGIQVLLAGVLHWASASLAVKADQKPFLEVAMKDVDGLLVEGPNGKQVRLVRRKDEWRVQDPQEFPADATRVQGLLDKLGALKRGTPVGQSGDARTRFKVADEDFERRLTLKQGDKVLATVLLGTSPGFKVTHARLRPSQDIFGVEFSTWEVGVEPGEWQNKELLKVPLADISTLDVEGLSFARVEAPTPKAPAPGETRKPEPSWELRAGQGRLKSEAAEKLAGLLAGRRFDQVLAPLHPKATGLDTPALTLTLTRKQGEKLSYRLGKTPDKEEYTLQVSNRPEVFRLASSTATSLLEAAARKNLVEGK